MTTKNRRETTNKHVKNQQNTRKISHNPNQLQTKSKHRQKRNKNTEITHRNKQNNDQHNLPLDLHTQPPQQSIKISRFFKTKKLTNQIRVFFLDGDRARHGRVQKLVICM